MARLTERECRALNEAIKRVPTDELPSLIAEAMNEYLSREDTEGANEIVSTFDARRDEREYFAAVRAAFAA